MSVRSASLTAVTRKPLLRTASTKPRFSRLSIASRTGVAETLNLAASAGGEHSPGGISPAMIAADSAVSTWCAS